MTGRVPIDRRRRGADRRAGATRPRAAAGTRDRVAAAARRDAARRRSPMHQSEQRQRRGDGDPQAAEVRAESAGHRDDGGDEGEQQRQRRRASAPTRARSVVHSSNGHDTATLREPRCDAVARACAFAAARRADRRVDRPVEVLASDATGQTPRRVERVGVAMGSELRLTAWTADEAAARAAFDAVFAEFERLEALMSTWRPGSDVLADQRRGRRAGRCRSPPRCATCCGRRGRSASGPTARSTSRSAR